MKEELVNQDIMGDNVREAGNAQLYCFIDVRFCVLFAPSDPDPASRYTSNWP